MRDLKVKQAIMNQFNKDLFGSDSYRQWVAGKNIVPTMGVLYSIYRSGKWMKIIYHTPLDEEKTISLRINGSILENAKRIH